jgi:three-Cys-motif partner protein
MVRKSHSENTVGPWAKQKLDALESYLAAYHLVMQNQRFKLIYIDAFAGAGWSKVRGKTTDDGMTNLLFDEEQAFAEDEFIAGSPVRALATGRGFDQYYFFDADPRRAELLEELKGQYPGKKITVSIGDSNDGVQKLAQRFKVSPGARGVAFLDPYGPNLHWKTVEALAKTGQVDVILNFPLAMAINRLITRDPNIRENWVRMLDECFGTREWYELSYEAPPANLFGDAEGTQKSNATAERLLALYLGRLEEAFGYVAAPSLVSNTKGAPLYYLIWAASNPRGLKIANHILKLGPKVKPPRKP